MFLFLQKYWSKSSVLFELRSVVQIWRQTLIWSTWFFPPLTWNFSIRSNEIWIPYPIRTSWSPIMNECWNECNPAFVPNDSLQLFWRKRYMNVRRGFRFVSEDNEVIGEFFFPHRLWFRCALHISRLNYPRVRSKNFEIFRQEPPQVLSRRQLLPIQDCGKVVQSFLRVVPS